MPLLGLNMMHTTYESDIILDKNAAEIERIGLAIFKRHLGVPLTVYPWYLLCSLGILGDYNP